VSDPVPAASLPEVRAAATVILVRDAPTTGVEVLMLRRHPDSVFAARAWVFPGGVVEPGDLEAARLVTGLTDAAASAALGLVSGGLAYWVAAVRECFEEAGILLAVRPDGSALDLASPWVANRFARHRRDIHRGRRSLVEVLTAEGLVLDCTSVHYVSHWVTPPGGTRRFDTRFFVAAAPPGQTAAHDAAEIDGSAWISPAAALEGRRQGELHVVYPTIKNLEALTNFERTADVLEAAGSAVPPGGPGVSPDFGEPPCPT
jgi:8-oxo-dGTP pyrophosphatase MutT (NUDIX family)